MRMHQSGVAIVLAMAVVALAALAATAMMASQSVWSRHVELAVGQVQARLLLQAGLDWARAVLSDDRRTSSADHLGEPWALRLPPIPVDNGSLSGRIDDLQGRFNLNNLLKNGKADPAQAAIFRRLLATLALPPALADVLVERINANARPLADASELAQLRGFDESACARLRPFVTALPRFTAVNANTATPEVLAAVVEGLGIDGARRMVEQREHAYFRNLGDLSSRLPRGIAAPTENVAVNSDYFVASMRVAIGGAEARGSALLQRDDDGWPAVVWRRFP
jgi:general secretion pathway protein K